MGWVTLGPAGSFRPGQDDDPARGRPGQEADPVSGGRPSFWRGLERCHRRKILEDPESLYKLEIQDLEITKDLD